MISRDAAERDEIVSVWSKDIEEIIGGMILLGRTSNMRKRSFRKYLLARREDDALFPRPPSLILIGRSYDSLSSLPEIESYWTDGKFRRDTIIPDIGRSEST